MSNGKKIVCSFCKTKFFNFNKENVQCPICKKNIIVEKKYDEYYSIYEKDNNNLDDISDEDLINKVIPQHFYEILEVLDSLDANGDDIQEENNEEYDIENL